MVTGTLISGASRREQEVEVCIPTAGGCACAACRCTAKPADRAVAGPAHRREPGRYRAGRAGARHGALRARPVPRGARRSIAARSAALGQAAEASRAGAFPLRDGRDRSRGAAARRRHGSAARARAAYARIVLREPALLLPGDRFIIRMFSPVVTIGGGVVLDIGGDRRYRKTDSSAGRAGCAGVPGPSGAQSRCWCGKPHPA